MLGQALGLWLNYLNNRLTNCSIRVVIFSNTKKSLVVPPLDVLSLCVLQGTVRLKKHAHKSYMYIHQPDQTFIFPDMIYVRHSIYHFGIHGVAFSSGIHSYRDCPIIRLKRSLDNQCYGISDSHYVFSICNSPSLQLQSRVDTSVSLIVINQSSQSIIIFIIATGLI